MPLRPEEKAERIDRQVRVADRHLRNLRMAIRTSRRWGLAAILARDPIGRARLEVWHEDAKEAAVSEAERVLAATYRLARMGADTEVERIGRWIERETGPSIQASTN